MSPAKNLNQIDILLVEDLVSDVELILDTFNVEKVLNNLFVVADGVEAMACLKTQGKYAEMTRPDLILLDLNLPKKDGREVLAEIKADPNLKSIPVVILTSSDAEQDILRSYELQANCYISKPVNLEQFIKVIHLLETFWLTVVKLPQG